MRREMGNACATPEDTSYDALAAEALGRARVMLSRCESPHPRALASAAIRDALASFDVSPPLGVVLAIRDHITIIIDKNKG